MGTQTSVQTSQTTTPTATEEEKALNKAKLAQFNAYEPGQTQMYQNAFTLGNKLLTSFGNSDQWNSLIGGITNKQTQSMINTQDKALTSQLQQSGIYDSGTAASGRLRAGAELANTNAQFNVGALQNALNLALSGQAQVQGQANTSSSSLSTALAGLRSNQSSGTVSTGTNNLNLGVLGSWCWVAAEIFGGWDKPKTCMARYYIGNYAPAWFRKFYYKHGERIAKFIHNKPILKLALQPLFECFAIMGKKQMEGVLI